MGMGRKRTIERVRSTPYGRWPEAALTAGPHAFRAPRAGPRGIRSSVKSCVATGSYTGDRDRRGAPDGDRPAAPGAAQPEPDVQPHDMIARRIAPHVDREPGRIGLRIDGIAAPEPLLLHGEAGVGGEIDDHRGVLRDGEAAIDREGDRQRGGLTGGNLDALGHPDVPPGLALGMGRRPHQQHQGEPASEAAHATQRYGCHGRKHSRASRATAAPITESASRARRAASVRPWSRSRGRRSLPP